VAFVFGDMTLDGVRRELRSGSTSLPIEPQVFDLLEFLIRNRERVVSRDDLLAAVWGGRVVSDSAIDARINAARRAIGDDGGRQRWIRTIARKGFRFVGDVREDLGTPSLPAAAAAPGLPDSGSRVQEITFCRTKDGVGLALACAGQGPPLVGIPSWLSHLEYDWQGPLRGPLWHFLAGRFRLVRYDGRGLGLSDRNVTDISLATFERDLEAVVDALALRRYALFGISQGASTAIAHAVRYPERVSRMVLVGGFARGRNKRADKDAILAKAFLDIMREGWGEEDSVLLGIFSSLYSPGASPEQMKWHARLQRACASAETAVKLRSACDNVDIADLLPKVSVPTLVLHSRHDKAVPFEEGRRLAGSIENAKFVSLQSENHVPLAGEPAWPALLHAVAGFLSEPGTVSQPTRVVRLARP
jgi:DNA-binding winged helix-turn-helix (wHTH) protein